MQSGTFNSVLVVGKLSCTEHTPAAMRTVGVLIYGGDTNVVSAFMNLLEETHGVLNVHQSNFSAKVPIITIMGIWIG